MPSDRPVDSDTFTLDRAGSSMGASGTFHTGIFAIDGELTAEGDLGLARLSPRWLGFARRFLRANGAVFRKPIDAQGLSHIEYKFTAYDGMALGSFYARGELVASTGYFTGTDPQGEAALQTMFLDSLRRIDLVRHAAASPTPFAALRSIEERPLQVVVAWGQLSVPDEDHQVISELANHFAGAFFYADESGSV